MKDTPSVHAGGGNTGTLDQSVLQNTRTSPRASSGHVSDYAKIHAGKIVLQYRLFSPREIVEEVAQQTQQHISSNKIRVFNYTPPQLPDPLGGDPKLLKKMFSVLTDNACHFTNSGEIYLGCELIELDEKNATAVIRFEVRDTGIGIDNHNIPDLFKPFVKFDEHIHPENSTQNGLGLSILNKLANLMGGSVHLESARNLGSRFWFDIPLAISATQTRFQAYNKGLLKGKYILVISDSETSRFILKQYLRNWEARPIIANNEQEALRMLKNSLTLNEPFYALLVDLVNAREQQNLLNTLQSNKRLNNLPTILTHVPECNASELPANTAAILKEPYDRNSLRHALTDSVRIFHTKTNDSEPAPTKTTSQSVLLLEKNPVDAIISKSILEELDIRLDHLRDEKQLIQQIIDNHYELLLIDLQVVHKSIYDTGVVSILRAWEKHTGQKPLTIIALAPYVPGVEPVEFLTAAGVNDYVPKPVRKAELLETANKWLDNKWLDIISGKQTLNN